MNFGEILGYMSDSIGIGTFIVTVIIWYLVKRENKTLLELALKNSPTSEGFKTLSEENKEIKSSKPIAVCICLLDSVESIKPQVRVFLQNNEMKMPFKELNSNGIYNLEDLAKLNEELVKMKREITAEGKSEIHLFIAGPIFAGVLIGSIFNNWLPVKVYHKGKINYEYQYLLQ